MKKQKIIVLGVVFILALISCAVPTGPAQETAGAVVFGETATAAARAASPLDVDGAFVTIRTTGGTVVMNNQRISLVMWPDGSFTSEEITLDAGNYNLTMFVLVDDSDTPLYATPIQGSPKSLLVNNPLPIGFSIAGGETTNVVPEVLDITEEDNPLSFGYTVFGVTIVENTLYNHITLRDTSVGADGIWQTDDDEMTYYCLVTNYIDGMKIETDYVTIGADGIWFTDDDVVGSYDRYYIDTDGRQYRRVEYNGAGADGIWFTADDDIKRYKSFTYYTDGAWEYEIDHGAGDDGIWFTSDDAVISYTHYFEKTPEGVRERHWINDAGDDGIWFTADDVVYDYYYDTYVDGLRMEKINMRRGDDGIAFTADDYMRYRETYSYEGTTLLSVIRYDAMMTSDPSDDEILFVENREYF
ncbi:MAG: hypothetical protein JW904_01265 [Spirochaetales bacterium]|nr:hypothetical protein [Spirochaetales bacterium]